MPMVGGAGGVPGRDWVSAGIQCLTGGCKKLWEVGETVRCGAGLRSTSRSDEEGGGWLRVLEQWAVPNEGHGVPIAPILELLLLKRILVMPRLPHQLTLEVFNTDDFLEGLIGDRDKPEEEPSPKLQVALHGLRQEKVLAALIGSGSDDPAVVP